MSHESSGTKINIYQSEEKTEGWKTKGSATYKAYQLSKVEEESLGLHGYFWYGITNLY